jgi:molybdenum cofactor synthesis domain-containing protein
MFKIAIITLSDTASRGERQDLSGQEIRKMIGELGEVVYYEILPDDIGLIEKKLKELCDNNIADLILTTGGTGFTERDITPEATKLVIEREVPGISEYMRIKSAEISKNAILSRGISGIRKKTLIINLPGSVKAVKENLAFVLSVIPHALEKLKGDISPCGD